jgi:hypothetical protein
MQLFLQSSVSITENFRPYLYTLMANLFQINQFVMLFRKNIIEKTFTNWRVLPLVKINTRISDTPCIHQNFKSYFSPSCPPKG